MANIKNWSPLTQRQINDVVHRNTAATSEELNALASKVDAEKLENAVAGAPQDVLDKYSNLSNNLKNLGALAANPDQHTATSDASWQALTDGVDKLVGDLDLGAKKAPVETTDDTRTRINPPATSGPDESTVPKPASGLGSVPRGSSRPGGGELTDIGNRKDNGHYRAWVGSKSGDQTVYATAWSAKADGQTDKHKLKLSNEKGEDITPEALKKGRHGVFDYTNGARFVSMPANTVETESGSKKTSGYYMVSNGKAVDVFTGEPVKVDQVNDYAKANQGKWIAQAKVEKLGSDLMMDKVIKGSVDREK